MHAKTPKEQDSILDVVTSINKSYGAGTLQWLNSKHNIDVERVSSGCLSLDLAIGGGVPKGRVIEIYGNESSGKTTMALHMVSEFQKAGSQAAYIDAEHALDPEYAKKLGVDLDKLLISQPDCGENALEIVEQLVSTGKVGVIVIDSVAALTPRAELEGVMGQAHMGLLARLMSQALRKLTAITAKSGCTLIFLNQIRFKLGVIFGSPETTPGGNALKFYSSVRIDLRKRKPTETGTGDDKIAVATPVKAKIVKNKVAPPFRKAEFEIRYDHGIDKAGDLLNLAVKFKMVEKKGAFYKIGDQNIQGFEKSRQYLIDNPKVAKEFKKTILNSL